MASGLRAQLRRAMPLFTSKNNILANRFSAAGVPSRTRPKPPLTPSPQPTPPPLWMDTQVAPRKESPMTLWMAISAVNRLPS